MKLTRETVENWREHAKAIAEWEGNCDCVLIDDFPTIAAVLDAAVAYAEAREAVRNASPVPHSLWDALNEAEKALAALIEVWEVPGE
jgi:hypothetical protein